MLSFRFCRILERAVDLQLHDPEIYSPRGNGGPVEGADLWSQSLECSSGKESRSLPSCSQQSRACWEILDPGMVVKIRPGQKHSLLHFQKHFLPGNLKSTVTSCTVSACSDCFSRFLPAAWFWWGRKGLCIFDNLFSRPSFEANHKVIKILYQLARSCMGGEKLPRRETSSKWS